MRLLKFGFILFISFVLSNQNVNAQKKVITVNGKKVSNTESPSGAVLKEYPANTAGTKFVVNSSNSQANSLKAKKAKVVKAKNGVTPEEARRRSDARVKAALQEYRRKKRLSPKTKKKDN